MNYLSIFETFVRNAHELDETEDDRAVELHPFDTRNVHPDLPPKVRSLYDDGYFAESTFEAFKFVEKEVKTAASRRSGSGFALMMEIFNESNPVLKLNPLETESEVDEQKGYRHMFAGAQSGIRNPRGHETDLIDSPDLCLDHLSIASVLLRKLDDAGLRDS